MRTPAITTAIRSILAAALAAAFAATAMGQEPATSETSAEDVTELSDIQVVDDPLRVLPNEVSGSSFGFAKPILETPRSVSFISQETIELYGLSSVEDLGRVTPSVYTSSRYGIQGSVDVRGIPADTYIRGMKRLTLQGNARSVLAAMDSIEVVKGPPSPLYGMGKIGGYTNFVPKSGRAKIGGYLPDMQGFAQAIAGSLSREEFSGGLGGPLGVFGKKGGFYLYGLLEDTDSYYRATPYDQKIVQLASSIDNAFGPFRLETGVNYQDGLTAGALSSRVNQDLVDNNRHIRGEPLVNLDLNGNGVIGYREMHTASPARGRLSGDNLPLVQTFPWPTDSAGNYLPLEQFPKIGGIPESMYNYLVAHPEADPTGLLRAQGIGAPLPISGFVPVGFVLDPRTVGYTYLTDEQRRRASAHERELNAVFTTGFIDLVYDANPDFTMKNQLFFDSMDQYKISNQPLYLTNEVTVIENKFTITKRLTKVPEWLRVNNLASINVRRTEAHSTSGAGGDLAMSRVDITSPTWIDNLAGRTPNTTFATAGDNSDINNDGAPFTADGRTVFVEYGLGLMWDVDLFSKLNLLFGGRYDYSTAENEEAAGTFNATTGTSANPGAFRAVGSSAKGNDDGVSWSGSLSYDLGWGFRPYVTMARSSLTLDGNNNRIGNAVVLAGHVGDAELKEAGIKASLLRDKLFFSVAGYEQRRTSITENPDDPLLNAEVTSTIGRGVETEIKWVPSRGLALSIFGLKQDVKFNPNTGGAFNFDARALGFVDVLDANGNVIYPAEAFLYGGNARIELPDGLPEYAARTNNPEYQAGANINYNVPPGKGFFSGFGFTVSANWNSEVCSSRICLIEVPEEKTANIGIYKAFKSLDIKLDVTNLTDETYYRPRQYNANSGKLLNAAPGRRISLTAKMNFK